MSQDNIQPDTQESNEEYGSLEEAVFSGDIGSDNIASAFTSGNEVTNETAPVETGQPEVVNEETNQQPTQNNDENRYQYWQSQADKYKNELDQVKQQQAAPVQPEAPVQPAEPAVDEFPSAPSRPQQPRTFNREEAYTDSSSESARYLDELEGWRDNMNEYNSLKSQYQTAIIEEKFNNMEQARVDEIKKTQAAQEEASRVNEVKRHVMGNHGMSDGEAQDFMSKMSDPSSITVDNLVQLYRMQKGGAAPVSNTPAEPSPTFTQTRNAQQVPSPMGVLPTGQNNSENNSFEDKMMDTMIGNFNSKNPWK
tara:strand:- start:990 stop:1916 length:927 start_codon:yes stop_codon:yes gene_type:complete